MAFNEMVERIERANSAQRRFLDDASHELRSPMTVIRGHVELLELENDRDEARRDGQDDHRGDRPDEPHRRGPPALARSERPGFLTLGQSTSPSSPRTCIAGPRCCARGLEPRERAAPSSGRPQRLTQALVQYAQNVCEHTLRPATVSDRRGRAHVDIWVEDDGPGVPPDQQQIFDRFVRGAGGRNPASGCRSSPRSRKRTVARRGWSTGHGGRGARFELSFPADVVDANAGPSELSTAATRSASGNGWTM